MSRPIKFRAWSQIEAKWYTGDAVYLARSDGDGIHLSHIRQLDVQQYTGAKDRNGVEIYEGDVVRRKGANRDVRFAGGSFTLNHDDHCYTNISSYKAEELEVIGNIYENPELLHDK